jgi:hypothetical protein
MSSLISGRVPCLHRYAVRPEPPADVVELTSSLRRHLGPGPHRDDSTESFLPERVGSSNMHATIRRYEAIDKTRMVDL